MQGSLHSYATSGVKKRNTSRKIDLPLPSMCVCLQLKDIRQLHLDKKHNELIDAKSIHKNM